MKRIFRLVFLNFGKFSRKIWEPFEMVKFMRDYALQFLLSYLADRKTRFKQIGIDKLIGQRTLDTDGAIQ